MAKKKGTAAKKLKGEIKGFIDEYKDKLILLAVSFFESKAKYMVGWLKDLGHLRRKLKALVLYFGLVIAGIFLIVFGAADYVAYRWDVLAHGWSKVLVGVAAIIVGYLIKKLS